MHLLLAQKGTISDGEEAVDLGQSPGDILFLSAADTSQINLERIKGFITDLGGATSHTAILARSMNIASTPRTSRSERRLRISSMTAGGRRMCRRKSSSGCSVGRKR